MKDCDISSSSGNSSEKELLFSDNEVDHLDHHEYEQKEKSKRYVPGQ